MPTPSGPSTTPSDADRLRLRSLEAGDAERLVDGFAHLSLESRHLRYFYPKKRLSPAEVDQLTHPDHRDHEAVAAFSHESGVLLGVARFVREPDDPSVASITAIVGDRFQGHGIGSALLREVAARARQAGVQRLRADILAENRRMLQLAFRLWPAHRTVHRGLGVVEVEFDLTAGGPTASRRRRRRPDPTGGRTPALSRGAGSRGCDLALPSAVDVEDGSGAQA